MSIINLILISILSVSFLACTKSGDVSFNSKEILDLEFLDKPTEVSGDTSPTFNFELKNTVNDTKVSDQIEFKCSLDSAAYIACPELYNPSGLPVGPHNLKIKVLRAGVQIHFKEYDWIVTIAAVPFNINGVSGANDSAADIYYANNTNTDLVVAWEAAVNADEYIVELKDNTDTTTLCGPVTVSTNTHTFTTGGLCSLVDGTSYKLHVSAENIVDTVTVATNSPLTITKDVTSPTGSFTTAPATPSNLTTASFVFTSGDTISGVAGTECRLDAVAFAPCTSPQNLSGLSEGAHTYDLRITDNAGNSTVVTHVWEVNTIVVNDFNYFPAQESVLFNNTFTATGGSGTFTYALTVNPNGATIHPTTGVFAVTEANHQKTNYTLTVTDTVTSLTKDFTFDVDTYPAGICVWNGFTDTDWSTASNWSFCGGAAPIATSKVAVGTAVNQPVLATDTTIDSFGLGEGGGEVTVNSGVSLRTTNLVQTYRSSIKFIGQDTTCVDCYIWPFGNQKIVDGATLTLLSGVTVQDNSDQIIYVGDGVTAGHLKVIASNVSDKSTWPIYESAWRSPITVEGTVSEKSTIEINGFKNRGYHHTKGSYVFKDHFEILGFDNIEIDSAKGSALDAIIEATSCVNGVFTDLNWDNISFGSLIPNTTVNAANIDMRGTACSGLGPITVSGAGPGYGHLFEKDPNDILDWVNSESLNCVWNGSVDSSWINPSNWSSCTNDRNNYPDQLDRVVVPVTGNDPVVSVDNTTILGTGVGVGGGSIVVNSGVDFYIYHATESIQSDVTLKGDSTTCTDCFVRPLGDFYIVNDSTLTLGNGIYLAMDGQRRAYLGDGSSAGHLATLANTGNQNEWPRVGATNFYFNGIHLNGTAFNKSSVSFDGIYIEKVWQGAEALLNFINHYAIVKFDNTVLDSLLVGPNPGATKERYSKSFIQLSNCSNGTFNDINWDNIEFYENYAAVGGASVNASNNCSGTSVNISGSGDGFGAPFENDPNNVVNWVNSSSFTCVWTGAVDTNWGNPGNWSSCLNGRSDYPDAIDWVVIPVTVNQPVITSDRTILGFGSGIGGGTITVNSGVELDIFHTTETIKSDVTIKGDSTTCTTCLFRPSQDLYIVNDGHLTLGNGITLNINGHNSVYVGDSITAGHFSTVPNTGNSLEWPKIDSTFYFDGIHVEGAVGNLSSVQIDGLHINELRGFGGIHLNFMDYYSINRLDNLSMNVNADTTTDEHRVAYIDLNSCSNGVFVDTTWDNLNFVDVVQSSFSGYNISAESAACGPISITNPTGLGAGSPGEDDPFSVINW